MSTNTPKEGDIGVREGQNQNLPKVIYVDMRNWMNKAQDKDYWRPLENAASSINLVRFS